MIVINGFVEHLLRSLYIPTHIYKANTLKPYLDNISYNEIFTKGPETGGGGPADRLLEDVAQPGRVPAGGRGAGGQSAGTRTQAVVHSH